VANVITVLYIISFGLFIYGLMGLTGPKTAVRGNLIAAVGMGLAILATALRPGMGHWWLIAIGLVIGAVVGVPAARQVKMTAMPQMVALFNGVGGGAVALISWVEFNSTHGYHGAAGYVAVTSLFAAIVGSVSFWGSLIAFGKLQEVLPGKAIGIGRLQQPLNLLLLVVAVVCAVLIGTGVGAGALIAGVLLPGAVLGVMVAPPIGLRVPFSTMRMLIRSAAIRRSTTLSIRLRSSAFLRSRVMSGCRQSAGSCGPSVRKRARSSADSASGLARAARCRASASSA